MEQEGKLTIDSIRGGGIEEDGEQDTFENERKDFEGDHGWVEKGASLEGNLIKILKKKV